MIIGIDGNEANVEKKVGVGEYSYQLLCEFAKYAASHDDISFVVYLKSNPRSDMPEETEKWHYKVFGPGKAWTQFALPAKLYFSKDRPDVFFTPTHYGPRFSPIPTVISVLDLAFIFFPELFRKQDLYKLQKWTAYSVRHSSRIMTISQSSKFDIMKQYNLSEDKVVVTHLGIKPIQKKTSDFMKIAEKYGITDSYILFVSTLQPRKNIVRLIEAFSKVKASQSQNLKDLELVIIGKKGWHYEEILAAPEKYNVSDSVKFLDFVPDEDLSSFYTNALFFALPSLYEGFGLPVLEAMKYGCPVLTSNVSSLPEAGGEAALYCDPEKVSDIAEKMQKLATDKKLRENLKEKGFTQIKKFSWEKAAHETLDVLKSVANKK